MDSDIVQKVRELAFRLSVRGTQPGHVGENTRQLTEEVRQQLVKMLNSEADKHTTTEFQRYKRDEDGNIVYVDEVGHYVDEKGHEKEKSYKVAILEPDPDREPVTWIIPNGKGEILNAMIQHLMAAVWGKASFSPDQREQAIQAAAHALPKLCDQLQALPDSSVASPSKTEIERTTEGTRTTETADTDDILENESEIVRHWCELCKKLKDHWFKAIEKAGADIPRQTFFKQFFARPNLPRIWIDSGWSGMMKKFRANENEWLVEYERLKTSVRKADT